MVDAYRFRLEKYWQFCGTLNLVNERGGKSKDIVSDEGQISFSETP